VTPVTDDMFWDSMIRPGDNKEPKIKVRPPPPPDTGTSGLKKKSGYFVILERNVFSIFIFYYLFYF